MTRIYGNLIHHTWKAYINYTSETTGDNVSLAIRGDCQSNNTEGTVYYNAVNAQDTGGFTQYTTTGAGTLTGTNQTTVSTSAQGIYASLSPSVNWTWPRTHAAYTVTISWSLTLNNWVQSMTDYSDGFQGHGGPYTNTSSCSTTITIPAKSSYSVSYNVNGGSGAPGAQTKWYNENISLSSTKPTRSGYKFVCWNTAANGSGTSYYPGGTYTQNAALALYAIWAELPNVTAVSARRYGADPAVTDDLGGKMAVTFSWSNSSSARITNFYVSVVPNEPSSHTDFNDEYQPPSSEISGSHTMYFGAGNNVYPDQRYTITVVATNANDQVTKTYTVNAVDSSVYSKPTAVPTIIRSDANRNNDICGEYIDVTTAITADKSESDSHLVYAHAVRFGSDGAWYNFDLSSDESSGHKLLGPYTATQLSPQQAYDIYISVTDKFYTVINKHTLSVATAYQLPTIEVTGIRRVAPDGVTEDALGGYLLVTGRYTITETNTQQQPTASTGKVSAAPGGSALPTVVHFIDDSGPAQSRQDAWEYPNDEDRYDPIPVGGTYTLSKTPNGTVTVMGERLVAVPEGELGSSYTYEPDDEFTVGVAATSTRLWISYDGDKTFTALLPENANGANDKLIRCMFDYEYNEGVPSTTAGTAEGPNTIDARPGRKTAIQTFGELLLSVMRPDEVYYATFTVSDRFNTASTTVQVPVSNYTFPMVYDLEPKRVIMVPDNPALPDGPSHPEPSDDGTDLLVDVSWAIYGSVTQTEPQEFNVTVVSEEGQTIVDRDYSLPSTTSGQPSELLFKSGDPDIVLSVPFSQDLQYTVKVTVTDRYSLAELSSVLTSAFFTLDVKKGGHGIAFGKPATRHVMDVRFPGYFDQAFHIGEQLSLPVYHRLKVPKSALPCLPAIVLVESSSGVTTYLAEDGTDILDEPVESEMHTSLSDYDASNGYFHPADYTKPFVWPSAAVSGANPGWYAENDTPSGEHNPYYFTSVQLPVESGKKFYSVIDAYLQTDAGEIMKFVPELGNTFNDYVVDMDASKPPFSNGGTDISSTGKFFHFKHFEGCGWHSDASSGSVNGTFHVVYEVEDA